MKLLKIFSSFIYLNVLAFIVLGIILYFIESPEVLIQKARINKHNEKYKTLSEKVDSISSILEGELVLADQTYRDILELDSLPAGVRFAGTGGSDPYGSAPKSYTSQIYADLNLKINNLKDRLRVQDESYDIILETALEKNRKLAHFPGITPVKSGEYVWISSYYGQRTDPFTHRHRRHLGLDFVGPRNTNIYTTAKGIVTLAKHSRRGYGNEIVIDHGFGYSTRYAHLNEIKVEVGQSVERGELIGVMGSTGRSTGRHLHYEVRLNNRPVNPIYFFADDLTPEEFERLTKKQNTN